MEKEQGFIRVSPGVAPELYTTSVPTRTVILPRAVKVFSHVGKVSAWKNHDTCLHPALDVIL